MATNGPERLSRVSVWRACELHPVGNTTLRLRNLTGVMPPARRLGESARRLGHGWGKGETGSKRAYSGLSFGYKVCTYVCASFINEG